MKHILIALLLFGISFGIRLYDLNATGGLWDEDIYFQAGYNNIYNLRNLDFSPNKWGWNNEHPPLAKYIYGIGSYASYHFPDSPDYRQRLNYGIPRIFSALVGSLTVVLIYIIGVSFFSPFVGLTAAIVLSLSPQFIAYNKALELGTPLTFFGTAALYFFFKFLKGSPYAVLPASVFVGLAGSSRYDGFVLIPIFLCIYGVHLLLNRKKILTKVNLFSVASLVLIPPLVLIAIWPYVWIDTYNRLQASVQFQQQHIKSVNLLQLPKLFVFIQPMGILLTFIFGLVLSVKKLKTNRYPVYLTIFLLLYFVIIVSLKLQGAVRYILISLIPLSLLTAYALEYIANRVRSSKYVIAFVLVVYLSVLNIWIHPYYLDFYNEIALGRAGAEKFQLPTQPRGEGIRESIAYINKHAPDGAYIKTVGLLDEAPPLRSGLLKLNKYGDSMQKDGRILSTTEDGLTPMYADYWVFNPHYLVPDYKIANNPHYELFFESKAAGDIPLVSVYKLRK